MDFGTLLHMAKKNSEESKNDVSKINNQNKSEKLQEHFTLRKKIVEQHLQKKKIVIKKHVFLIDP